MLISGIAEGEAGASFGASAFALWPGRAALVVAFFSTDFFFAGAFFGAGAAGMAMPGIGWVSAGVAIPAANALAATTRWRRVKFVPLAQGSARS